MDRESNLRKCLSFLEHLHKKYGCFGSLTLWPRILHKLEVTQQQEACLLVSHRQVSFLSLLLQPYAAQATHLEHHTSLSHAWLDAQRLGRLEPNPYWRTIQDKHGSKNRLELPEPD